MQRGTIIIANDLLGFVVNVSGDYSVVRDKNGEEHTILSKCCTEVSNPFALAALMWNKASKKV